MSWADDIIKSMKIEEKVGQVIISRGLDYLESMEHMLQNGLLGGVGAVVIRDNCKRDPYKIVEYINRLGSMSKIPLFLYTDCERGITDMFPIGTSFPDSMAIGATHDPETAYCVAKAIAEEAKMLGFGIICNPVLDVNTNPENPIIGTRAFGERADFVTGFGEQYIRGVQEAGVIPTGKHFPGHGDTCVDSHVSMPVVYHSRQRLEEVELKPFRELVKSGMKGIMTAHIYYPGLQAGEVEGTPATLSRRILTDMLKKEWNFDGLVVSDSLTMRAIKDRYGIGNAAVMAFKAGNDMILQDYNSDPKITHEALLDAVGKNEINEIELDASVLKILKFKEWCGLNINRTISMNVLEKLNGSNNEHMALSKTVAKKSITVLENKSLPIRPNSKTLLIAVRSDERVNAAQDMGTIVSGKCGYLYDSLKRYQPDARLVTVAESPTAQETGRIKELISQYENIVFVSFVRILSYKQGSGKIPDEQVELVKLLNEQCGNVTMIVVGNPYVLRELPSTANVLCTYSDCSYSIDAALDILYGSAKSEGKLPVTIDDRYVFGYGLP